MKVVKLFQSKEELIRNKVDGLIDALIDTDDEYTIYVLEQLAAYLELNYDGAYIDNALSKILEAKFWLELCELTYQAIDEKEEIEEKK